MKIGPVPYTTWVIWCVLSLATVFALWTQHWSNVFMIVTALTLTLLPAVLSRRFMVRLPMNMLAAISVFVFATLFLGEVFAFYDRYWWWDVVLHGFSAMGFGIIGFLFMFYLFEGDKYAAPPWAIAFMAFCFAVAIGAVWEIFEFAMDQAFGMNMQKSGLIDTMWDLIVDCGGALIGSISGFLWMKGSQVGPAGMMQEFVELNRRNFRKLKDRRQERKARGRDYREIETDEV